MVKARSDGVTACGDGFAENADGDVVPCGVAEVDYLPINATRINATDTTGGLTLIKL